MWLTLTKIFLDEINHFDGTHSYYFHNEERGEHSQWDKLFNNSDQYAIMGIG